MNPAQTERFYASRQSPMADHTGHTFNSSHRRYSYEPDSDTASWTDGGESEVPSDLTGSHIQGPEQIVSNEGPSRPIHTSTAKPSYAERARTRPGLAQLDTTSDERSAAAVDQSPVNVASPISGVRRRPLGDTRQVNPSQQASYQDRSPLQKLETTLGDISKEEKRARVERAEQLAVQRGGQHDTTGSERGHMRSGSGVHRKPVPASETLPERFKLLGRERSASSAGYDEEPITGTAQIGRSVSGKTYEHTRATKNGAPLLGRTLSGRGNYDSAWTGSAAAQATEALQAARTRRPESSYKYDSPGINASRSTSATRVASGGSFTSQRQDHDATLGSSRANKLVPHRDPVAGEDVLASNDTGATYVIPPQTLEGQQARQQIAFGHTDPNQQHHQQHLDGQDHHDKPKEHKRAHFSDYLHINDHRERRYVESDGIADWQHAQIATLTAADLDLNIKRGDNTRLDWDQRNASQGQGSTQHTTFNPPLLLKCGPLLRYTGIDAGTDAAKKYWRGTVMIVTEDHSSSYQHPPTLRLFKQPGELVPAADAAEARYSDEVDHVAGQIKLGRRGQTLYVRPVHELRHEADLSRVEDDTGLFETIVHNHSAAARVATIDGEKVRQYQDVQGHRLHAERGVTFWRFMLEVELTEEQQRIAYRINEGAPVAFWVPSKHQMMNIMFHSCNGFSHSVKSDLWCGPDPLWRDVMRQHQTKPFHCMIGGGDQIYMDACMKETVLFKEWCEDKGESKHKASLTSEMQDELEQFYLDRYSMWFSTGMFGLANSQIPMVNVWDDHDIIDGFGSYPHHFQSTAVFAGAGAIAYKYYMLFQQQSVPDETTKHEPSWLLGNHPGPYINQLSRSLFMSLGDNAFFLGLDCRTERTRDEILSQETYDLVFDRCRRELISGQTRHLIVLLGVPIAYPRLVWLENVLTSRALDPIKALTRFGMLSNFVNKFDGGVEILDDLDDHWTAKHHKHERNWFIQELQELAREKSVRITILGGDVHLAAAGEFYSNPKLNVPKDQDHRYMPNVISSAIVNAPPADTMADFLNKRNKVHHLDPETDEGMIPLFVKDVDGKARRNKSLFPRRNWCSISEYHPEDRPDDEEYDDDETLRAGRSFSLTRKGSWGRNASRSRSITRRDPVRGNLLARASSTQRAAPPSSYNTKAHENTWDPEPHDVIATGIESGEVGATQVIKEEDRGRSASHLRRPSGLTRKRSQKDKTGRAGLIDIRGGLDIGIHCEIDPKNPSGTTQQYRLLVPALAYQQDNDERLGMKEKVRGFFQRSKSKNRGYADREPYHDEGEYDHHDEHSVHVDGQDDGGVNDHSYLSHHEPQSSHDTLPASAAYPQKQHNIPDQQLEETDRHQTTASHQRASMDSDHRPSQKVLERLPRSSAPLDDDEPAFHRRHTSSSASRPGSSGRGRISNNAMGPPPPANIDRLPPSVQQRYQQYAQHQSADSQQQEQRSPQNTYGQPNTVNTPFAFAPPSSYQHQQQPSAVTRSREYSAGSMESPLLPINQAYLRSSEKRTNIDAATYMEQQAYQQGQQGYLPQQQAMAQDRRIISSPATFGDKPSQSQYQSQSAGRDPYAQYTESPALSTHTLQAAQTGSANKLQRHFGAPDPSSPTHNNSASSAGYTPGLSKGQGHYDPHYIPSGPVGAIPLPGVATAPTQHDPDSTSLFSSSTNQSSALPPARQVHPPTNNPHGLPDKVARHFDDIPAANASIGVDHPPTSSAKARGGGGFAGMIRRLSGSGRKEKDANAPGIWKTEGEREREGRRLEEAERIRTSEARRGDAGRMNLSNVVDAREEEIRRAEGGARDGWGEQGLVRGKLREGDEYQPGERERRYEEENRMRAEDGYGDEEEDGEGVDDGYADDGKRKRRSWKPWKL